MRKITFAIAMMASLFASAQISTTPISLHAIQGDKRVGEIVTSFKVSPEGQKVTDTRMSIDFGAAKAVITISTTIDPLGFPVRKIQKSQIGESGDKVNIVVDFSKTNARYIREIKGVRTVENYPAPEGVSTADASEFWFVRDRPGTGSKVKFASFNIDLKKWEIVETAYVGKKTVTVDSVERNGFGITVTRDGKSADLVIDEKGQMIQMITPDGLRIERAK